MQLPSLSPAQRTIALGAFACVAIVIGALAARSRDDDGLDPAPQQEVVGPPTDTVAADAAPTEERRPSVTSDGEPAASRSTGSRADSGVGGPSVSTTSDAESSRGYRKGEDPAFAESMGWPVDGPEPLTGSILPSHRIVAYYGNPLSKRMGALGEYPKDEMLRRFQAQLDAWNKADPETPVQPALHMIAVVAQGEPGPSGKYRTIMRDTLIEQVYRWAKEIDGILFIDIQPGQSSIRELLPRFDHFLDRPDVHLAIDPEFTMKAGVVPGSRIGSLDAEDINFAIEHLAKLVREHNLPPKVLVIHRFTRGMVTNASSIRPQPEVQVVMHMDGWGAPWLKRDSYRDYIVREPVQYTGFKLFYHNDTKNGDALMSPADVLRLAPRPLYIQYQ